MCNNDRINLNTERRYYPGNPVKMDMGRYYCVLVILIVAIRAAETNGEFLQGFSTLS